MNLTKFDGIVYPFFGLKEKPYAISYDLTRIYVVRHKDSHRETVDDKSLQGDYFARLAQLNKRLKFDATCKDIQQLIISQIKWGMDATAKPFDLSNKEPFKAMNEKIVKTRGSYIFVKGVSYPYKMHTNETLEISKTDEMYTTMIYVDGEWYPYEITNEWKDVKSVFI